LESLEGFLRGGCPRTIPQVRRGRVSVLNATVAGLGLEADAGNREETLAGGGPLLCPEIWKSSAGLSKW